MKTQNNDCLVTLFNFFTKGLMNALKINRIRTEVFNALHDRYNVYWGRKTLLHANRDVKAWSALAFFPEGCRALLRRQKWYVQYRLLVHFLPLMISQVKIS